MVPCGAASLLQGQGNSSHFRGDALFCISIFDLLQKAGRVRKSAHTWKAVARAMVASFCSAFVGGQPIVMEVCV
jgi:hypothetical protein